MTHHINLVVQTLSRLPWVVWLESLLQCLYFYFAHSLKKRLKFTKILELVATKGNQILWNVKTRWISMLSPTKIIMEKYKTLRVKMAWDNRTSQQVMLIYEHLCMLWSNLHNLEMYLCMIWWQPSRFAEVMFITCTMVRLLGSL
jgi:hypothetical protein